jgi:exosortase O
MSPAAWRQGLPAALLLVGALPFGEHLQTFVGYPVRILTAAIVRQGLAALGVHTVGIDTILVFESGISKIDLPCSGVKSLWTGGLFWLAATWIEGRAIRLRWLLMGVGFALLLLLANLVRVAVLVTAGPVAGYNLLAEMLHVPLGVLGFVGACTAAVALLRRLPGATMQTEDSPEIAASGLPRPFWLAPLLGSVFLGMALFYTPRPMVALAESRPAWQFPPNLDAKPWPLTAGERQWLADSGVDHADRFHFQWEGYSGSLLLVTGNTWRAHHRPESCFQVYGLTVEQTYTHLVAPDFPIRLLALSTQGGIGRLSAAYWLQSAGQTTDDYATRIWADVAPHPQRWVLVTILFDQPVDPATDETQELYQALHAAIGENLQEGTTQ